MKLEIPCVPFEGIACTVCLKVLIFHMKIFYLLVVNSVLGSPGSVGRGGGGGARVIMRFKKGRVQPLKFALEMFGPDHHHPPPPPLALDLLLRSRVAIYTSS